MNIFIFFVFVFREVLSIIYALTENELYILPSKKNFEKGLEECRKVSLNLLRIEDLDANKIVYDFATRMSLKNYYIDANDRKTEGEWLNSDGKKVEFTNFKEGQPDNQDSKEHCINGFNENGKWDDIPCDEELSIICHSLNKPAITEKQIHVMPKSANFDAAIALCKEKSMNLIKANDPATNLFVQKFAERISLANYWLDGTDKVKEGEWCNNDGTKIPFLNFRENQPDNWQNNENCMEANRHNPTWNDIVCETEMAVMCYSENPSP